MIPLFEGYHEIFLTIDFSFLLYMLIFVLTDPKSIDDQGKLHVRIYLVLYVPMLIKYLEILVALDPISNADVLKTKDSINRFILSNDI